MQNNIKRQSTHKFPGIWSLSRTLCLFKAPPTHSKRHCNKHAVQQPSPTDFSTPLAATQQAPRGIQKANKQEQQSPKHPHKL